MLEAVTWKRCSQRDVVLPGPRLSHNITTAVSCVSMCVSSRLFAYLLHGGNGALKVKQNILHAMLYEAEELLWRRLRG